MLWQRRHSGKLKIQPPKQLPMSPCKAECTRRSGQCTLHSHCTRQNAQGAPCSGQGSTKQNWKSSSPKQLPMSPRRAKCTRRSGHLASQGQGFKQYALDATCVTHGIANTLCMLSKFSPSLKRYRFAYRIAGQGHREHGITVQRQSRFDKENDSYAQRAQAKLDIDAPQAAPHVAMQSTRHEAQWTKRSAPWARQNAPCTSPNAQCPRHKAQCTKQLPMSPCSAECTRRNGQCTLHSHCRMQIAPGAPCCGKGSRKQKGKSSPPKQLPMSPCRAECTTRSGQCTMRAAQ